jgi:hypothetical protein
MGRQMHYHVTHILPWYNPKTRRQCLPLIKVHHFKVKTITSYANSGKNHIDMKFLEKYEITFKMIFDKKLEIITITSQKWWQPLWFWKSWSFNLLQGSSLCSIKSSATTSSPSISWPIFYMMFWNQQEHWIYFKKF